MNSNLKKLIFDIGMFDGADTRYYLNKGYKVLAVEANTVLVKRAKEILFNEHINNGDLTILNFALTDGTKKNVSLTISATEPGASTILDDEYYNCYCYYVGLFLSSFYKIFWVFSNFCCCTNYHHRMDYSLL